MLQPAPFARIEILGVAVHLLTIAELHHYLLQVIQKGQKAAILNVNVHALNLAYSHEWLKSYFNQAEIVFCDGAGVMLAARWLGHHIPERITYADWMWQLAQWAELHQLSLYFLGGKPNIAEKAAQKIHQQFPKLLIAGTHHGYFQKHGQENEAIIQQINQIRPHILVLGLGMPTQEQWLLHNWHKLQVNVALTGGAVFDYLSGELVRAPRWMTQNGLEWLGRLIIEPSRLWKRYILGNPLFLWRLWKQKRQKF